MNTESNQYGAITSAIFPTREEPVFAYQITIQQQAYGYIVNVGCKVFAIETSEKLIELLSRYLQNPKEVQKQFEEGTLFKAAQ